MDDTEVEGNETVNLELSNPIGGASLGTQTSAVLTILDKDNNLPATPGRDNIVGTPEDDVITASLKCCYT